MPPAVVSPQGSRAGLITYSIVASILAVTAIITTFYFAQKQGDAERLYQQKVEADKQYFAPEAPSDQRVQALLAMKDQQGFAGLTDALSISMSMSDQLAKQLAGNLPPDKAIQQGKAVISDNAKKISVLNSSKLVDFNLQSDWPLTLALITVTDQVSQLATANKDKQDQLTAATAKYDETVKAQKDLLDQKDKAIAESNTKVDAALADAKKYQEEAAAANEALKQSGNQEITKLQTTIAALNKDVATRDAAFKKVDKENLGLKAKLRIARIPTAEAVVQQADGNVTRIADNKTVYINIGRHQSVTKGLTFEVYDKNKGIPSLGDPVQALSENNLPVGKGSLEVFNVGDDTSECRVVRIEPGQQFVQGDLIANLIFDPKTKYTFVVYGDFDLSNSGMISPSDANVIREKVVQWGGKVATQVDTNTDFLVVGKEPVVPPVTDPNDVQQVNLHNKALKASADFQEMISRASALGVPVMNQNRFLYFIGFYDSASR